MLSKEIPVPFVELVWDDADTTAEWTTEVDDKEELVHTLGFLVKETKNSYYIAHTVYVDEEDKLTFNGRIRIPKGMVKEFNVIFESS